MAIWIQSLSWTLILSLGQGIVVFSLLWLALKMLPSLPANVKYHLSLSSLTVLLAWFAVTWWQQYHSLAAANDQLLAAQALNGGITVYEWPAIASIKNYGSYRPLLSSIKVTLPWIAALYVAGFVFMLLRLSAGVFQLFAVRKNGLTLPGSLFDDLLLSLKKRMNFDSRAQLFISAKAKVPMVVGFLKPMILMPAATLAQLSAEQLETILIHELAHIKRYDYLVNILQTVVETILFFNPFVWMVSAITRREREHCCDDIVLAHTQKPLDYATALAALANEQVNLSTLTIAASGKSYHLFSRIERIMEMKKNPFSYSRMIAAIFIIISITCSIAWISPALAKPKTTKLNATATAAPAKTDPSDVYAAEANQLVLQLMADNLIDQAKGFSVVKKQNELYIDGTKQADEIAEKYLRTITQENIRVNVAPFNERILQHPDAGFLQNASPILFSSPCVDTDPKKPGC